MNSKNNTQEKPKKKRMSIVNDQLLSKTIWGNHNNESMVGTPLINDQASSV